MSDPRRIARVTCHVLSQGGADYHAQGSDHWIVGRIATPMSRYPQYRASRTSWGLDVLGTLVVEVETTGGVVGFGVSTGGWPAAWIVENHLRRFLLGARVDEIERLWDQMYRATIFYGRKGLAMNAISAVDLALWDTLGRVRQEPVYAMIGGAVREHIACYATGPRPDLAREMGFVGGKLPLTYAPADGAEGLRRNIESFAAMRQAVGEDFWLMLDCWMALDLPYTLALMEGLRPYGLRWIEECLLPDDYWGYARIRAAAPAGTLVATGEHEATRHGFRLLLEMKCADIIQPDVGWCGGLTELLRISALADAHGVWTIPHGSSVYSYHFVITRPETPFAEFLMMAPDAARVVPMFQPLLEDEPVPVEGRLRLTDRPGFGVELNRALLAASEAPPRNTLT